MLSISSMFLEESLINTLSMTRFVPRFKNPQFVKLAHILLCIFRFSHYTCLLSQLFPDVLLLAAEPQGSSIFWVPALWAGKSPRGPARHPGPWRDPVRQHGWVLNGAWGRWRSGSHWGAVSSVPEGPGLCDHSGGPPPQPLRPLSPTWDKPSPLWLPGEPGHASVVFHSHVASTAVLPLHPQPHSGSHTNCGAAGGQGSVQKNALAVMASL